MYTQDQLDGELAFVDSTLAEEMTERLVEQLTPMLLDGLGKACMAPYFYIFVPLTITGGAGYHDDRHYKIIFSSALLAQRAASDHLSGTLLDEGAAAGVSVFFHQIHKKADDCSVLFHVYPLAATPLVRGTTCTTVQVPR